MSEIAPAIPSLTATTTDGATPEAPSSDFDSGSSEGLQDAIAAARAALHGEGGVEDTEIPDVPGVQKEKPQQAQAQKTESVDELIDDVSKTLEKRKLIAQEKLRVREELSQERQKLESSWSELKAKQKEVDDGINWLKMFRSNPVEAVRAAGWEPEQFIADLANDGTPEHQQKQTLSRYEQEINQLKQRLEQRERSEQERAEQYRIEQQRQYVASREQQFLQTAVSDEFPALQSIFNGPRARYLVQEAHEVAEAYYQASGKVADFKDIAAYLNEQYSGGVSATKSSAPRGKPLQGKRGTSLGSLGPERGTGVDPDAEDDDDSAIRKAIAATRMTLRKEVR